MNLRCSSDLDDLSVSMAELMVATSDGADNVIHAAVPEVLRVLRTKLQMDVVFVSEFVDGERVFRFVDREPGAPALQVGTGNPLEESFCQWVIDGRMPELVTDVGALPPSLGLPAMPVKVGAHLSTAVVLSDGSVYGTLCCFSLRANPQLRDQDLSNLKLCAQLVARKLEISRGAGQPVAHGWQDTAPAPD